MPKVTFITEKNEKKVIEVPPGANLRQEARKNGIHLYPGIHKVLNCMGMGTCTSCRVQVKSGGENLSPPGVWEKTNMIVNPLAFFARIGHESDLRLACQCQVNGDCEVQVQPAMNWSGEKFWE